MYYKKHIFFCCNQKSDNTGCKSLGGEDAFIYAKKILQEKLYWGKGLCRATKSGCLGICNSGPICVVYPDGIWYSYCDLDDIREIIEQHVINDIVVNRLKL
jgi:(2Fe-2S) ferredoxin